MKKRLLSILLMCCMVLTLLPTTAFAEESTETPPVCSCETACTAENMNTACPVCGAEGALPQNCAKCARPADAAAVQPEGEVSAPQPEAALTALIGESEMPAAGETVKEVSTADELTKAIADSTVNTVKLTTDISISSSLTVTRTVTLDLNGRQQLKIPVLESRRFLQLNVDYDKARSYRNSRGCVLWPKQWKDLTVKVVL